MSDAKRKLPHAEIVFARGPISLPILGNPERPISYDDAIAIIEAKKSEETTVRRFSMTLPCHPLDGGRATQMAMAQLFGATVPHPESRPSTISVKLGDQDYNIPWGQFLWPLQAQDLKQWIGTSNGTDELGNGVFVLIGNLQARYEKEWNALCLRIREIVRDYSILLGQTIRITFTNDDNDVMPWPKLESWDVRNIDTSTLCYTKTTEEIIEQLVYAPIDNYHAFIRAGERFNRGILSTGPFGTGKSMLNASIAKHGQQAGMTVFYTSKTQDAARCLRFAQLYATRERPAIVFIEDIEAICDGPEKKTEAVGELMNVLDGVDTKNSNVLFICTTNYYERLYLGLKRSRRIDLTINILAPDADAAGRIVRAYLTQQGEELYAPDVDFDAVGRVCDGMVAADISEVCTRAKVAHIAKTGAAPTRHSINTHSILAAANSVAAEIEMRRPTMTREVSPIERAAMLVAAALSEDERFREFRALASSLPTQATVAKGAAPTLATSQSQF